MARTPAAFTLLATLFTGLMQSDAAGLLDRAIAAAGGERALAAAGVLSWRATAIAHRPDGPAQLEGVWVIEPPDRAAVETWEPGKRQATSRRLLLDGTQGWLVRGSEREPLPAAAVASERDQLYLYAVMRLLPLRDPEVELSLAAPRTLLVRHARRPDVVVEFDESVRLQRMRTTVSHPADNSDIEHEMVFAETLTAHGLRWPRTIRIVQDGRLTFEMTISELSTASKVEMEGR